VKDADGLNGRQRAFVSAYLITGNATSAAIAAGYKAVNAQVTGPRLLGNVFVAQAISRAQERVSLAAEVHASDVLRELARIAFSDMRAFTAWDKDGVSLRDSADLTEDQARCVSEVSQTVTKDGGSIRFKLHDKPSALTLLGKHLGLFPERVSVDDPTKLPRHEVERRAKELRRTLKLA
jgi:phage terminase small subunit